MHCFLHGQSNIVVTLLRPYWTVKLCSRATQGWQTLCTAKNRPWHQIGKPVDYTYCTVGLCVEPMMTRVTRIHDLYQGSLKPPHLNLYCNFVINLLLFCRRPISHSLVFAFFFPLLEVWSVKRRHLESLLSKNFLETIGFFFKQL